MFDENNEFSAIFPRNLFEFCDILVFFTQLIMTHSDDGR